MADTMPISDLDDIQPEQFDGNLTISYDKVRKLALLHDLCTFEKYASIRKTVKYLSIIAINGNDLDPSDHFLDLWKEIANPDEFPQLSAIDIIFEAKRYKFRIKEPDFEVPTEEWFRVRTQDYIDLFNKGEEDIEYEYPSELLQLQDLRQLLTAKNMESCNVLLTTRVSWGTTRRQDTQEQEEEENDTQQVVKFKVSKDDLEAIERSYR